VAVLEGDAWPPTRLRLAAANEFADLLAAERDGEIALADDADQLVAVVMSSRAVLLIANLAFSGCQMVGRRQPV
jgi:hypothetical protein